MADLPPKTASDLDPLPEFRWQAFFQNADSPLFLLNRRRRILFVNKAWETLTGLSLANVRGMVCTRQCPPDPTVEEVVAQTLWPSPEVKGDRPMRVRRLFSVAGKKPRWWDIDFFPFHKGNQWFGLLGKILPIAQDEISSSLPLPPQVAALREKLARWYAPDLLANLQPTMQGIANQVRLAQQVRTPVLIQGEPGTGKQWLARAIHYQGVTCDGPFAALDCELLPPAALAELLDGAGKIFHLTNKGLLYIREPHLLPRDLQWRLNEGIHAHDESGSRVIAGSSVSLLSEVGSGRFLGDLYYSLGTISIQLPPLRERFSDLPILVDRFLNKNNGRNNQAAKALTTAARAAMQCYRWPGNLAELFAVLRAALERSKGETIDTKHLPGYILRAATLARVSAATPGRALPLDVLLEEVERRLITLALGEAKGNKTQAAERLSIWRARLIRRMEALGIGAQSNDADNEEAKLPHPIDPAVE